MTKALKLKDISVIKTEEVLESYKPVSILGGLISWNRRVAVEHIGCDLIITATNIRHIYLNGEKYIKEAK